MNPEFANQVVDLCGAKRGSATDWALASATRATVPVHYGFRVALPDNGLLYNHSPSGHTSGKGHVIASTPFGMAWVKAHYFDGVTLFEAYPPHGEHFHNYTHWSGYYQAMAQRCRMSGVPILVKDGIMGKPMLWGVEDWEFALALSLVWHVDYAVRQAAEESRAQAWREEHGQEYAFSRGVSRWIAAEQSRSERAKPKPPTSRVVSGSRRRRNARRRTDR